MTVTPYLDEDDFAVLAATPAEHWTVSDVQQVAKLANDGKLHHVDGDLMQGMSSLIQIGRASIGKNEVVRRLGGWEVFGKPERYALAIDAALAALKE